MAKPSVLFIKSSGQMVREHKEAKSLANRGYPVSCFAWDRSGGKPRKKCFDGYSVHYWSHRAGESTLAHLFSLFVWWLVIFHCVFRDKPSILHVSDLDCLIPVLPFTVFGQKQVVYDVCDYYFMGLPSLVPSHVVHVVKKLEFLCMRFPTRVILVAENRLRDDLPNRKDDYQIIMNTAPDAMETVEPSLPTSVNESDFIIYYGGWISEYRAIPKILQIVKNLRGVTLVIAGNANGEVGDMVQNFSNRFESIHYVGIVEYSKSLSYSLAANVIFAYYDPKLPAHRDASPNKAFDAMSCGTPLITNEGTELTKLVENEDFGWVVPFDRDEELVALLQDLAKNPEEVKKKGQNGRSAFDQKYSWSRMEDRLIEIYEGIST